MPMPHVRRRLRNAVDCPFCGENNTQMKRTPSHATILTYIVQCVNCGANGPTATDAEDAFRQWNRRRASGTTVVCVDSTSPTPQ